MAQVPRSKFAQVAAQSWLAKDFASLSRPQLLELHRWTGPTGEKWLDDLGVVYYGPGIEMATKTAFRNFLLALSKGAVIARKMTTCFEEYCWTQKQNFFAEAHQLVLNPAGDSTLIPLVAIPMLSSLRPYANMLNTLIAGYCSFVKDAVFSSPEHAATFTYAGTPMLMYHFPTFAAVVNVALRDYAPFKAMTANERLSLTGIRWVNLVADFVSNCDLADYMYIHGFFCSKVLQVTAKLPIGAIVPLIGQYAVQHPTLVTAASVSAAELGPVPKVVSVKLQLPSTMSVPKAAATFKVGRELTQAANTRLSSGTGALLALSKGFGFTGIPTDRVRELHLICSIIHQKLQGKEVLSVQLAKTDFIGPIMETMTYRCTQAQIARLFFIVGYSDRAGLSAYLPRLSTTYVTGSCRLIFLSPKAVSLVSGSDDAKYNEHSKVYFESMLKTEAQDKGFPSFVMFANVTGSYPFDSGFHVYRYGYAVASDVWNAIVSSDPLVLSGFEGSAKAGQISETLVTVLSVVPDEKNKLVTSPFRVFDKFGLFVREAIRETAQVEALGLFPRVNYSPICNVVRLKFEGLNATEDCWSFQSNVSDEGVSPEYAFPDPSVGQDKVKNVTETTASAGTSSSAPMPSAIHKTMIMPYASWQNLSDDIACPHIEGLPDSMSEPVYDLVWHYAQLDEGSALVSLSKGADLFSFDTGENLLSIPLVPWVWKGLSAIARVRNFALPDAVPEMIF